MSKSMQVVVLVTGLMASLGIVSAAAGAVTWHNSGSTAFTATAGSRTLSATAISLNCTGASATGDAPAGATAGAIYSVRGTLNYTNCLLSNIPFQIECGYTLTATSQSGSVTSGTVDVTCGWYEFGAKVCHEAGTVSATYSNPISGVGVLTLATGGNVIVSNPATGSCPLGNGDRAHLSELTFRTTSAGPPVVIRTT